MSDRSTDASRLPLLEILRVIEGELATGAASINLRILDPDRGRGCYAGEGVEIDGHVHLHRPWRVWLELGDRLGLRMCTPIRLATPWCELRYERLPETASREAPNDVRERYGTASEFARVRKAEEPTFVLDLVDALARVEPAPNARILVLGVNRGDELALIHALRPELLDAATWVGVDHSASAIAQARERFPDPRHRFIEADVGELAALELGRFDLVVAIDLLQSPGVDDRALLRQLVQAQLEPDGALILGLPNCRYHGPELVHGARMKNFAQAELSLVVADIAHYRRYLHQHRRKVFVTGRHELLITAIPERRLR